MQFRHPEVAVQLYREAGDEWQDERGYAELVKLRSIPKFSPYITESEDELRQKLMPLQARRLKLLDKIRAIA